MGDTYREILVKKKTTAGDRIKKVLMIAAAALLIIAGLFTSLWIVLAGIVMVGVCVYFLPAFDLEYEYLYVNGELDIDKIMGKQRRKKCGSYDLKQMEYLAPSASHSLDQYRQNGRAKVVDYTSGEEGVPSWTIVMNQDSSRQLILVELDQEIIDDLRRIAPRKVERTF